VCKLQGGLGILDIELMNRALLGNGFGSGLLILKKAGEDC